MRAFLKTTLIHLTFWLTVWTVADFIADAPPLWTAGRMREWFIAGAGFCFGYWWPRR